MPSSPSRRPFGPARFDGRDVDDSDLDEVVFDGTDFVRAHAEGRTFLECTLVGCDVTEASLRSSRWSDCHWERVHGVGLDIAESSLADTVLDGCRLGAVSGWGSHWRDVEVRGGKIDFLNLRGASLRDVRFVDCVVIELDLQETIAERVSFEGCTLVEPQFGRGSYAAVDLSGATLRAPRGVAALRGATISRLQLLDLADQLAAELGLSLAD